MSIFSSIRKALPFQIVRKPQRKQTIYNSGYNWLFPYLSPYLGTDRAKSAKVNWGTYYMAMDNEWISSCINAYIIDTLSANFDVYGIENKEDDDPDVIAYIKDLYNRPDGPEGRDSYTKFMWRGLASYLGPGDWFSEVVYDDTIRGLPVGMYFIQPHRMTYHYDTDQWGLIGTDIRYENDELIHVMIPDPWNELYGKSDIDKAAKSMTMDILARDFNQDFFKSKMDPRGAIKFEKEMTEDQVKTSTKILQENAKKYPRGHVILHGGDYQKITQSNRDLEFTTLLNMMRDRIISVYGVPPQNVGVYTSGSLGNEKDNTADKKFKKRLQGKVFKIVGDEFNNTLGKSFDIFGWDERFHFGDIDLEDKQIRANIENIRLRNGSKLINEVRAGYGEDPVSYGDEPMPYVGGVGGYTFNQLSMKNKRVNRDVSAVKSILKDKGYLKAV